MEFMLLNHRPWSVIAKNVLAIEKDSLIRIRNKISREHYVFGNEIGHESQINNKFSN